MGPLLPWLVFAFTTACASSELTAGTTATEDQLAEIQLRLYTGETTDDYTSALVGEALDLLPKIDVGKPTVAYIFGWTESPYSESVETVVSAYLKRQDHNVILVNWEEIAAESYLIAATSAGSVGSAVASGLNDLVAAGLDPTTLHIVSHSLGSQIAGFVGRSVNFTLPRITGLDPAGPGFYLTIDDLNADDADFVDVIHTDAGVYGTSSSKATVNFYPNGGSRLQPGCPAIRQPLSEEDFCDHHRSWYYYAESVLIDRAFVGVECTSYALFQLRLCTSNTRAAMGYSTPTTASGNFYLRTNSESPYGLGEDVETYEA